eukprot:97020-Alexandrium_andersonii.AAC.1
MGEIVRGSENATGSSLTPKRGTPCAVSARASSCSAPSRSPPPGPVGRRLRRGPQRHRAGTH